MGLHLSPVQAAAVEILLVMEERHKAEDFAERFKLAVISSDPKRWVAEMFPGWKREAEGPVEVDPDEDLSDTTGAWVFTESITPEEALAELAKAGEQIGGVIDLGEEWLEV